MTLTCRAEVWLLIASGGRWSLAELRKALPDRKEGAIDSAARALVQAGCLELRRGEPHTWGLTPDCTVPPGIPVEKVLAALKGDA